jgi:glutamate racemase
MSAPSQAPVVGVFDSGVGGLSVLAALMRDNPRVRWFYIADTAHAPYGDREPEHALQRSRHLTRLLLDQGARTVVVACNTATALAIDSLRREFEAVHFVGVEPGLKPAALATRNQRIGVLATPATLASERFAALAARLPPAVQLTVQPCPGLALQIESGALHDPALRQSLSAFCQPLHAAGVDTVVLGCTHYAFVRDAIEAEMGPGVAVLDTATAISRRVQSLLQDNALLPVEQAADWAPEPAPIRLASTGQRDALLRLAALCLPAGSFERVDLREPAQAQPAGGPAST